MTDKNHSFCCVVNNPEGYSCSEGEVIGMIQYSHCLSLKLQSLPAWARTKKTQKADRYLAQVTTGNILDGLYLMNEKLDREKYLNGEDR